ncbi:GDP-L-galactose phosphorylase 1 [Actinidia rufa]|uniref:GDP-L-galactose phosphorylase 1 n=1 Tax=Actinidia rufa TaxID=165716 RepID=A0A7J0GFE5_9ERIC|nr:GDP-L-galactose phosphorylase 1 [Actinidia rufa]
MLHMRDKRAGGAQQCARDTNRVVLNELYSDRRAAAKMSLFHSRLIGGDDLFSCAHKGGESHDNSQSDVLCGASRWGDASTSVWRCKHFCGKWYSPLMRSNVSQMLSCKSYGGAGSEGSNPLEESKPNGSPSLSRPSPTVVQAKLKLTDIHPWLRRQVLPEQINEQICRRPRRTLPEQIKRQATRKLQEEQLKKDQPTFLNAIADVEDASDNDSGDDMFGKRLLAVDDEETSVAFLDSLLLGEWEDHVQRGLFHYDVTACETKVIPGEYGFIAQLNEGRHLKKRPTEFRVDKVLQPFDGSKFNFTKVGQEEVLFQFFPNAQEGVHTRLVC